MAGYAFRCLEKDCDGEFSITADEEIETDLVVCVFCESERVNLIEYDKSMIDFPAEYARKLHELNKRVTEIEAVLTEAEKEDLQ